MELNADGRSSSGGSSSPASKGGTLQPLSTKLERQVKRKSQEMDSKRKLSIIGFSDEEVVGFSEGSIDEKQLPTQFHKTRMCYSFLEGRCSRDRSCNFAHAQGELRQAGEARQEFQERLDRRFQKMERKRHHKSEAAGSPYYKTQLCPKMMMGQCGNGKGCYFAHSQDELRPSPEVILMNQMMGMSMMMNSPMALMGAQMMGPQMPPPPGLPPLPPQLAPHMRPQLPLQMSPQMPPQMPPPMPPPMPVLAEPRASGTGMDKMSKRRTEKDDKAKKRKEKNTEKETLKEREREKEKERENIRERERNREREKQTEREKRQEKEQDKGKVKKDKLKEKDKARDPKAKKPERKVDEEDL